MSDDFTQPPKQRRRSNSLPIPQIEISVYHGPTSSRDSPTGSYIAKDCIEVPDAAAPTLSSAIDSIKPTAKAELPLLQRRRTIGAESAESVSKSGTVEKTKKRRVKMTDLRTLIESRMFSKSEKTLERVGLEASGGGRNGSSTPAAPSLCSVVRQLTADAQQHQQHKQPKSHKSATSPPTELQPADRSVSQQSCLDATTAETTLNVLSREPRSNLLKGSSMPSLR